MTPATLPPPLRPARLERVVRRAVRLLLGALLPGPVFLRLHGDFLRRRTWRTGP
jgi:hypothetical protein